MSAKKSEVSPETTEPVGNEFAIENLRLDQNFIETAGVKRLLTTVPVRKPGRQEYVRVHPHPDYRANVALIELEEDGDLYLVTPVMARELTGEFFMATLYTAINRQRVLTLWPVRLPAPDGRQSPWHKSAGGAARLAMEKWIRVRSNMSLGAYEIDAASETLSDPEWPNYTFQDLIPIAFKDRLVNRIDHPVVQRLRGLT
jgi:hypothetical protein